MTETARRVVDYSVASGVVAILVCVLGWVGSMMVTNLEDLRDEVHENDTDIAVLDARMDEIHKGGD